MNNFFDTLKLLFRLSKMEVKNNFFTMRMMVLVPLLLLFILGASWGFSDQNAQLPADVSANTPFEVLFLSSVFVLFSATLGVVLIGFDGISRKKISGLLAIEFCQPTSRTILGFSQLFGVWLTVALPTIIISLISILVIYKQMNEFPSISEIILFIFATSFVLLWYASIQLLVSSVAKDVGSAVTLGVGTWLLFTMIWLLITVVLATILGVDATDTDNLQFASFSSKVDMFSPNGLYQLLLEAKLDNVSRKLPIWQLSFATILWTIVPSSFFIWRFNKLSA
tara:strand:- start:246 stop:1088 length:843 start_codon:yes stop_codon:yes gene_type:complete